MKSKKIIGFSALIIAVMAVLITLNSKNKSIESPIQAVATDSTNYNEESYQTYLDNNGYKGIMSDNIVEVDLNDYSVSEEMEVAKSDTGIITGDVGAITWRFDVGEEGFYNLNVGYIAVEGTNSDIQRQILIDDNLCYDGLSQVAFKRYWTDEEIKKSGENEVRPNSMEVFKESNIYVQDYNRRSKEPYIFYLTKGAHTITFEVVKEPMEFTKLVFVSKPKISSYSEVIEELKSSYEAYTGENIICQAERLEGNTTYIEKSSPSINIQKNYSDSKLVPYHPFYIRYNTIGADSWSQPGDFISWEITVPKEGLYSLSFKGRQSSNRGVTAYRRLYINGETPYEEVQCLGFSYSSKMTNYTILDNHGDTLLFHLKEGSNTITLEAVLGEFGGIVNEVEESMYQLNQMYLNVIKLTGQSPDIYIDYEIRKKIPEFASVMEKESENLYRYVDEMVQITGEKGENTSLLEKMAIEAEGLAKNPEGVVEELTQFKNNISALGTWLVTISKMPLELDSYTVCKQNATITSPTDGVLDGAYYGTLRFASTFFQKKSQISTEEKKGNGKTIKVWMASAGREQAQMIQNMINETFTPKTGINVDLQLIPVDVVLRAALAGNGPDAVIGLSQTTLQDFAMRNAVVDLSKFEGYKEIASRFNESVITAGSYEGGNYGIPEQANFMMLFYRDDILKDLGLTVPKTWEQVKEVIPVLQKNNYNFYMPSTIIKTNMFSSMVYQNGGDLYDGEGLDYGIASGLDSDNAMTAFKQYTDLFTSFGLLVSVDFPNRFRTGEMPMGIIDYTTYCQLEIFAPEIKGLWSFAELPGVEQEDGTINNAYLVETVQAVIMQNSEDKEDSWEFIKWWTDTETQLNYANTLESIMGTAARYPAADREVLSNLPWSNKELTQLLAQLDATVGLPAVPGHYMTTRMIQYSFNGVVADFYNPREKLYLNVKSIDKELLKKRTEFKLSTITSSVVSTN